MFEVAIDSDEVRRRHARFPLHADFELLSPVLATGVVLNASEGGLRVTLDRPVNPGKVCWGRVRSAIESPPRERFRVAWVRELGDGYLVGLELDPVS